ncbi:MAG TPA: outer membrane protein [Pseudolabrys sp.]|jgi:outer membrane immunogenic protein|nr:outer membrane protein [Pseudolabrys sp.]
MKRILLASVGLLALGVASASAADIQRAMPAKAPVYVAPIYNWTGFYVGINGGGGWGHSDFSAPFTGSSNMSGGLVGGTFGYNWQMNQVVLGLETDIDWSNIRGSSACGFGFSCETKNTWLGTFRGRLGYAADRFMPYVTGGLAYGGVKTSVAGFGDSSTSKAGWTLGGGVEFAIAGPWTAKVEYLYVDLGRTSSVLGSDASFRTNIVRAGLNYRF